MLELDDEELYLAAIFSEKAESRLQTLLEESFPMVIDIKPMESLQALLSNAEGALAVNRAAHEDTHERLDAAHLRLDAIATELEELQSRCTDLEQQTIAHNKSLLAAKTANALARGSGQRNEEEAESRLVALLKAQPKLERQLAEARNRQQKQSAALAKERDSLHEQIIADEVKRADLEREQAEMEQVRSDAHTRLGQTIYEELARDMAAALETEANLEEALAAYRAERRALQNSLATRLEAWPGLAKRAKQEIDPNGQLPPEPPATVQVIEAGKRYLRGLAAFGHEIEGTQHFSHAHIIQFLSVPELLIKLVMFPNSGGQDFVKQKLQSLDDYQHQIEEEQERLRLRRMYA